MSGRKANEKQRLRALAEAILDNPPEELRDVVRVKDRGPVANLARVPDAERTGVIARFESSPASTDPGAEISTEGRAGISAIGEVFFTDADGVTSAHKARVLYSGVGVYVTDLPAHVNGSIWMQVNNGKRVYRLPLEARVGRTEWDVPLLGELSPLELRNCIRRCMVILTQIADPTDLDRVRDRQAWT